MGFLDENGAVILADEVKTYVGSTTVAKEDGKGLSSNDYTITEKNKLAGIATGATKVAVVNNLTSISTTDALSAYQGKVIADKLSSNSLQLHTIVGNNSSVVDASTLVAYIFDTYFKGSDTNKRTEIDVWAVNKTTDSRHTACALDFNNKYNELTGKNFTYAHIHFSTKPYFRTLIVEVRPLFDSKDNPIMKSWWGNNSDSWSSTLNQTSGWYLDGTKGSTLVFSGKSVATSAWSSDTTYEDYPYKATITCSGVTANHVPTVNFSLADATSGIFAPVALSAANAVTIYASEKPTSAITIQSIVCVKGV